MWNSGITQNDTSSGPSWNGRRSLRVEAMRLRCSSGTCFGRLVVPLVCRTIATSSGVPRSKPDRPVTGSPVAQQVRRPAGDGRDAQHRGAGGGGGRRGGRGQAGRHQQQPGGMSSRKNVYSVSV